MDVEDPQYADVAGVLLDPSCSGSGTTASRMDYLLPSHREKGAALDEVTYSSFGIKACVLMQVVHRLSMAMACDAQPPHIDRAPLWQHYNGNIRAMTLKHCSHGHSMV